MKTKQQIKCEVIEEVNKILMPNKVTAYNHNDLEAMFTAEIVKDALEKTFELTYEKTMANNKELTDDAVGKFES